MRFYKRVQCDFLCVIEMLKQLCGSLFLMLVYRGQTSAFAAKIHDIELNYTYILLLPDSVCLLQMPILSSSVLINKFNCCTVAFSTLEKK